jgi:hypothetical protein
MRQEINYHALRAIVDDIEVQQRRSPAFSLLNREKIRRFYQQNGLRVQTLNKNLDQFVTDYVVHEEGKPKTQDGENGRKEYVFVSDQQKEEYLAKYNEFMNLTFTLEV